MLEGGGNGASIWGCRIVARRDGGRWCLEWFGQRGDGHRPGLGARIAKEEETGVSSIRVRREAVNEAAAIRREVYPVSPCVFS